MQCFIHPHNELEYKNAFLILNMNRKNILMV